jgi:hypothetical protein
MTLINWSWKVLKKGVWVLGFVPQLLDYVSTYVPRKHVPDPILNLLEKGGNWQLTLVLVGVGLFASAYLVHLETIQALAERERRIRELESQRPDIVVGFQDSAGHLVKKLELQLNSLPPKPDFDTLVEAKRKELLAKRPSTRSRAGLAAAIVSASFSRPNPHYENEVEQYLVEFREFLAIAYECTIDRAYAIHPIIENKGNHPANDVTIEFAMPADYKEPAEHQCFDRSTISPEDMEFYLQPPPKPKPFIDQLDMLRDVALPDLSNTILSRIEPPSSIGGPNHEQRDGIHYISYAIERLVQHRPEDDFNPFWLWLFDVNDSTVWEIPFTVTSADLRLPQKGRLLFDIQVTETADSSANV